MRRFSACLLAICSLFSLFAASASAQAPAAPGPEHAMLKALEGEWDAVVKMGDDESKSVSRMRMGMGGLWLVTNFRGEAGGVAFEGHGLDGYDQDKKKFVSIWVDSMSSSPMFFEGTYDEKTKTCTMTAEGKGPDGKPARYKSKTMNRDNDHQVFEMYITDSSGQEQLMMTITYTRKKK